MNSTLIFDLDGTISDPSLGIIRCTNHALVAHGYEEVDSATVAPHIGPPLDLLFKAIVPGINESGLHSLVHSYRERYVEVGYSENILYAGVKDSIESLKQAGQRLGVCTSKRRDAAVKILELFGLIEHFDFVSGGDIGISKGEQLRNLLVDGVINSQSLMIGDRAVDITAARENNLKGVGVLWGFGSRQELDEVKPVSILNESYELRDVGEFL